MPEGIVRRVLRLVGYEVNGHEFDEEASTLTLWVGQNAADPFHRCRNCGISTRDVHDAKERRVRDLPWGEWRVWLIVTVHRVRCRRCGVTTEGIPFLDSRLARVSRRPADRTGQRPPHPQRAADRVEVPFLVVVERRVVPQPAVGVVRRGEDLAVVHVVVDVWRGGRHRLPPVAK